MNADIHIYSINIYLLSSYLRLSIYNQHSLYKTCLSTTNTPLIKLYLYVSWFRYSPYKTYLSTTNTSFTKPYLYVCICVLVSVQARNLEQKREWTLQLKRVILENYSANIPAHARQLVMELGQSKPEGVYRHGHFEYIAIF